jgi:superfamily II DNA or RNA helicase
MQITHKPGTLVTYRNRDWMVLPSADKDLLRIKPLGGTEEEETAVYLPLKLPGEEVTSANFPYPNPNDIGSFDTARLLYDAFRLSFRNAAGPFRCMGKLSFRPRSYQLVPLVMALKMDIIRLLIADDVGIGKTVEALLILKEMMERGEVRRFAVICPPHLCEQWEEELKDKLDIDAEIIRSSTVAKLDRQIPDDHSVFHHIKAQVISIDYVKSDRRRGIFLSDCPEFVIVDEAHTATLPEGATSRSQQQRYSLLHEISKDPNRHILLLTATPHSGKDSEFASLLGLLKPEFEQIDFERIDQNGRRRLARHFVQRKRENITRWLNEKTEFPERESLEIGFNMSPEYNLFYHNLIRFARGVSSKDAENEQTKLLRSWAAIALIKGAMSSPAMAIEMLANRENKLIADDALVQSDLDNTLFENAEVSSDVPRRDLIEGIDFQKDELTDLRNLQEEIKLIDQQKLDQKIERAINILDKWVKEGFYPIIFCHYIPTANYVAEKLKTHFSKNIHIEAITSELADEQRKERIELMGKSDKRILVATDCLSEGINLQEHFTAVLHYDLPWNPNRLEQREGRVDRFGQTAPLVKTYLLYGEDNQMDTFILEVLIRKVKEISKATGVSITIGENNASLMKEAAKRLFLEENNKDGIQQKLFVEDTIKTELENARRKGENLRSIFAHETIKPELIQKDLEEVDEAIGDIKTVEEFVRNAVQLLGGTCVPDGKSRYLLHPQNLPAHLKRALNSEKALKVSFDSPTPKGYRYLGRNHRFVELLCQFLIALAFEPKKEYGKVARVSEIQTDSVASRTTLIVFRVRNVISEVATNRETVAEEMYLWGYEAQPNGLKTLEFETSKKLLAEAKSLSNLPVERQSADIEEELKRFETMKDEFMEMTNERADKLVGAHGRFKELVGGKRFEKATPVLPPDVMGIYILLPKPKAL